MKIVMYTTPSCTKCLILNSQLADLDIELIDCIANPEKAKEMEVMHVPTIFINGRQLVNPTEAIVRKAIKELEYRL